jgi:putative lipoic acid-binding regulatory protein
MEISPLEFPCEYPVKVMGRRTPEFRPRMLEVLAAHGVPAEPEAISERLSRDGTYLSLTLSIRVDSRDQLDRIYRELHATGLVLFAL